MYKSFEMDWIAHQTSPDSGLVYQKTLSQDISTAQTLEQTAPEGNQWVELDSGCLEENNEYPIDITRNTNVRIHQTILTEPGSSYKLEFIARNRIGFNSPSQPP